MFTEQEIESFLHGNDPEEFIVAIEFDYAPTPSTKSKKFLVKVKKSVRIRLPHSHGLVIYATSTFMVVQRPLRRKP